MRASSHAIMAIRIRAKRAFRQLTNTSPVRGMLRKSPSLNNIEQKHLPV